MQRVRQMETGMSKQECEKKKKKNILGLIPTLVSDRGTKAAYAPK